MLKCLIASALVLVITFHARAEVEFDSAGQAHAIVDWPATIPFSSSVWIVSDGWKSIQQQSAIADVRHVDNSITGRFAMKNGLIEFEQSTRELAGMSRIDYELSSKSNIRLDGIYWFASISVERFGGGNVRIAGRQGQLPVRLGEKILMTGYADRVEITDKTGSTSIAIKFDRQLNITVQDARQFGKEGFQIYVPIVEDEIKPGMRARLGVSISSRAVQDNSPARIDVDVNKIVSNFDGFGGNFVYDIESPVTDFNLRTLKLTWARLGMDLADWEPTNDNASPADQVEDWGKLIDTPTSAIRRRFQLDARVHELSGDRTIVSVWRLPEWLYDNPIALTPSSLRDIAGKVKPEMWPELIECITSYLLHLKKNYGIEPALFSFNEPDYGIYLLLDGDELNQLYRQLGMAFETAGLKTKLMLPDSASLAQGMRLMQPALNDPETMKHVGALAYHAWIGEQNLWDSWAKVAESHKIPLLVTEAGLDSDAWRNSSYNSPIKALRLAERYVQLLGFSRAQGIMEWEWTGDYSLCHLDDGRYRPSSRYWMMWQLTRNTPNYGKIAATNSSRPNVNAAMVLAGEKDEPAFTLHIANTGQRRKIAVAGLPSIGRRVTVVTTEFFTDQPPSVTIVELPKAELKLNIPGGSLVTVTTLPVEEPKR